MLDTNIRSISFHDMLLSPYPAAAELITLDEMLNDWKARVSSGSSVYIINNETAVLRILKFDHNEDKNTLALLIHFLNGRAADPYFGDMTTGEVRVEPKRENEGIAVSAHVLIDLSLANPVNHSHICMIEKVSGVSRTAVERLFRYEFKAIAENFERRNSKGRVVLGRAIVNIDSYMSTTLRDLVLNNKLSEVQFIRREIIDDGLDEDPFIREHEFKTRFKLLKDWDPDTMWGRVRKWFEEARGKGIDRVRVRYKDNADKIQAAEVELGDESVDSLSFTKTSRIRMNKPIAQCEEDIRYDIIERMFRLLDEVKGS